MGKFVMPASAAALSNGIRVGPEKGHKVTKLPVGRSKNAPRVNKECEQKKLVKGIIREVAGLAPYEKRILDLIKLYGGGADKKIYKFSKKRLGSHKRAIKKRDDLKNLYAEMRSK